MPPVNAKNVPFAAASDLGIMGGGGVGDTDMLSDEEIEKRKKMQNQSVLMGGDGTSVFGGNSTGLGAAMMLFSSAGK